MSDKNYICTDCKFLTHPFIRIDKVSTEEAQALMDEVARDEEYFQTVNWDKIIRHSPTKNYVFYFSRDTGEFAFHTPETEKYKNHPIFQMIMVQVSIKVCKIRCSIFSSHRLLPPRMAFLLLRVSMV